MPEVSLPFFLSSSFKFQDDMEFYNVACRPVTDMAHLIRQDDALLFPYSRRDCSDQ